MSTLTHDKIKWWGLNQTVTKCNPKVKVKCVMWTECINGVAINHNLTPLPKQERMWALDAEEMESSSKINLKDVSWWMSIKNACKPGVPIIAKG